MVRGRGAGHPGVPPSARTAEESRPQRGTAGGTELGQCPREFEYPEPAELVGAAVGDQLGPLVADHLALLPEREGQHPHVDALGEVPGDGAAGHDRLVVGMSVDEQQPAIRRDTGHVSSQLTAVPKIETWMGPVSGTSRTADVVPTTIESWYSGR